MAFFYSYIPKNSQKMAKKQKNPKNTVFELNYRPENVKEMQKTVSI